MAGFTGTPRQSYASGGRMIAALAGNDPTYQDMVLPEIAYVQGVETPILSVLSDRVVHQTRFEQIMGQIDDIADSGAPFNTADNTVLGGDVETRDWTALTNMATNVPDNRVRSSNFTHIRSRPISVTRTQRLTAEYGVADEYDHQIWEQGYALGLDWEHILLWSLDDAGTGAAHGAGGPGDSRSTRGLVGWAHATGRTVGNVTIAGDVIPDFYSSTYLRHTGTDIDQRTFRESVLQPSWERGFEWGNAFTFVGTRVKNVLSEFSHIYSGSGATQSASPLNYRNIPASAYQVIDNLDVLEGDWGVMYVTKHRNMRITTPYPNFDASGFAITPATTLIAFEPRYVHKAVLEAPSITHLPPLFRGAAAWLSSEMGLYLRNPRAVTLAYDIAS